MNNTDIKLLLERVKSLLDSTSFDRWQKGGEKFVQGTRAEKAKDTSEWAYVISIPTGNLVFRCSTPVRSEFAGRGFVLNAIKAPLFTVELRTEAWKLNDLINPQRIQISNQEFEILAHGDDARDIFIFVSERLSKLEKDSYAKLEQKASELIKKLEDQDFFNTILWKEIESDSDMINYNAEYEMININIYQLTSNTGIKYAMRLSDDFSTFDVKRPEYVASLFKRIQENFKTSNLAKLAKVLEDV